MRLGMKRLAAGLAVLVLGLLPAAAQTPPAPSPEVVTVGVYPTVVDDLNIAASTYDAVAYVWFKWKGPIDPTVGVEFANSSERQNFTRQALLEQPQTLPDGSRYQILQIHGRFFQPFSLIDFPFDRQTLTIAIEDEVNAHHRIVYVPDLKDSGFAPGLQIPGWRMLGWHADATAQDYHSHFGAPQIAGGTRHSGLSFAIAIERRASFFLWKLFLPLLIVMCANWLAFLIKPDLVDVRTALTATALLTLVFLQKSYSDELPEIGTLVLMDKIYVVAYLLVIATLAHVVTVASWQKKATVTDARVVRVDWTSLAIHVAFFAVAVGIIVLSAGRG
ncbi:MAG TPA: hypothetical protein VHZ78_11135 [Rhizomicrobium sp.]|jgi:hypothetical protein|nr:hypothetical protein [Rhizomicrobium sp.]